MGFEDRVEIELNPRERRLYDRLRERLAAKTVRTRAQSPGLRDLVLLLPDLLVLMLRLLRDPRVGAADRLLVLLVVGYVLSPLDLLPSFAFGPLGFLDDLLLIAAALSRLLNRVHPDIVRSHWSGRGDLLEVIQRVAKTRFRS